MLRSYAYKGYVHIHIWSTGQASGVPLDGPVVMQLAWRRPGDHERLNYTGTDFARDQKQFRARIGYVWAETRSGGGASVAYMDPTLGRVLKAPLQK